MQTPFFPQLRQRLAALGRRVQTLRQHSLPHLDALIGLRNAGPVSERKEVCPGKEEFTMGGSSDFGLSDGAQSCD